MMLDFEQKTDEQLVALTLQNQDYYYFLMKRYESALLKYIYRLSGMNKVDAQDIFCLLYTSRCV